jgi:pilus assembly protein CpaB
VGVFVSLDEPSTHVVLHRVVVTQVQGAPTPVDAAEGDATQTASAGTAVPTTSLLVTLALTAEQAEGVVFGAEHGALWLSLENDGTDVDSTEVITPGNVYGKDYS